MCEEHDFRLFNAIVFNRDHVLYKLLPEKSKASQNYALRARVHDRELPERHNTLTDSNFIYRTLYYKVY